MNLSNAFFFASILTVATATAGVIDDAKFKLDIRGDANGNAYIDSDEIGDALDFSSPSRKTIKYGAGDYECSITDSQYASNGTSKYGTMPYIATLDSSLPFYATTPYGTSCIEFPQETKTENGTTYYARYGLRIQNGAVPPGSDGYVTIYARFRWDSSTTSPNLLVGNGWNGTWDSLNGQSIYADGEGKIGVMVRATSKSDGCPKATKGKWYDVFVTTHNETIGGTDKAVSVISMCEAKPSVQPAFTTTVITNNNEMGWTSANTLLVLGLFLNNSTGWNSNNKPRAFRGAVADVMLWDRALTDNEKYEVMAGPVPLGGEWQIGAVNGSADEFDDADPAEVYNVQSMPWRRMRKTLDASNPSLSLSMTMTPDDSRRNRTLTIVPLLSGTASAPVEVSLNGTAVGEIDLATTTSIALPRTLWLHGSGLANTITVTRKAPVAGTLQIDAVSLAAGEFGEAGTVLDDAFFKLDLRGGASTFTKPGDLGNAFDFSAASPLAGYMGDQRGPQTYNANFSNLPAQETADVQNPYYPYTTNTQTVLHFYQDFKGEDKGSVNSGIVIPGAAPHGLVQTYYIRFRWDGVAPAKTGEANAPAYIFMSGQSSNGNDQNNGVALNLDNITVKGTTTNAILACRVGASGTARYPQMTGTTLSAGKWIDAFVTFAANADNTGFTTTFSACTPSPTGNNFNPPQLRSQVTSSYGGLSFDSSNLSLGLYHDSANTRSPTRCFRGLIADFMIWDRALTDDEKIEVMAGQHGAKWRVGAINGSADEFTDTDPAAVFEPQSMPWRQMRKTLDASHPTLTLKSPLATFEANKPMILHVDPIFTETGSSVPVSVAVNGSVIGAFDLAKKRNFIIEKRFWQQDASGNVTVALTRTETKGSVAIDALSLSGSWQNVTADGDTNGMLNQQYSPSRAFAGDTNVKHFTSAMSVGASTTNYTFGVWVPAGAGAENGWKFRTKTTSRSNPIAGLDAQHTVYVNGTAVGSHDGWFAANEAFTLDIPAGTLHDGMNYVQWVQTLPTRAAQQAVEGKPGVFQFYDFWGMTLVPPPSAFFLIVR